MTHQISQEMRSCIDACLTCYRDCLETKAHCIGMGGKHVNAEHLGTLDDCAVLCETAANLMLRSSDLHADLCGVCADACERCADSCERLAGDDETMRRCAQTCRHCAESCRAMAGAA